MPALPIVPPPPVPPRWRSPFAFQALKEVKETSCTDAEAKNIARSTVAEAHQALTRDFVETHLTVDDGEKHTQHIGLLSVHLNIVGCCFFLCVCEWSGWCIQPKRLGVVDGWLVHIHIFTTFFFRAG